MPEVLKKVGGDIGDRKWSSWYLKVKLMHRLLERLQVGK